MEFFGENIEGEVDELNRHIGIPTWCPIDKHVVNE